ncbi:hypothetical protein V0288_19995 [Pannus brasiliensis CCIBt3594]|uniref:Apolipophorin-III n=1 Tax=Pannus brasiliensis CCIBt3594 TaxID=1427578 RepID=A0AAW9R0S8_9CHRO
MKTLLTKLGKILIISLALVVFCAGSLFLSPRPAMADTEENTLSGTLDNFLRSTVNTYREKTNASFSADLKALQKTVNELSEQLEKVADPRTDEETRQQLTGKILENQRTLQESADSFTRLATESENFDRELDRSARDFLDLVQGSVHPRLTDSRDSLQGIAGAISSLAEDTAGIDTADLKASIARVGNHINALNGAIESANRAVKALSR